MNATTGPLKPVACWSCKGPLNATALFCHTCGAVQPPRLVDHFARLGLGRGFDLDDGRLERNYVDFQRRLHPDRFAKRSALERRHSAEQTASLNEAYQVLKNPLSRALYLLSLEGVGLDGEGGRTIDDPELLMESIETREALAEAADTAAIEAIASANATAVARCESDLAGAFAAGELAGAKRLTTRLRYLVKLGQEVKSRRLAQAGLPP